MFFTKEQSQANEQTPKATISVETLNTYIFLCFPRYLHPSPNVMADFFRHKNQHDAPIQFAQFLVDLLNAC